MQDNLKDHIDQQRDEFEVYPFDTEKEWTKLESKITPKNSHFSHWKIAGIAACFLMVVFGVGFTHTNQGEVNNQLSELEKFYEGEIDQKVTLIKHQIGDDQILQDLNEMDQVFAELKTDLEENVDNEEVITAMMENYRLKLQILEEILVELEKEKREEIL